MPNPDAEGFANEVVAAGFVNPTDIAFSPDGRIFVIEKAGRVRAIHPDRRVTLWLDLRPFVNDQGDKGLLGIALHPRFEQNRLVYFAYSENRIPGVQETNHFAVTQSVVVRYTEALAFLPVSRLMWLDR